MLCSAHVPIDYQKINIDLCGMFFKTASKINLQTGQLSIYYRLVENSRNALGGIYRRNIMAVGYMDDVSAEELHGIADGLNERIAVQHPLFADSPKVSDYIEHLYTRLVKEKRIDRVLDSRKILSRCDWQRVDMNSVENRDVREPGAEWLCLQTLYRLKIDSYLVTVFLTKRKDWNPIFRVKQTNCLILRILYLYDLTNTYYEGVMRDSAIARHGRSKEKRSDCPLIVPALVVNISTCSITMWKVLSSTPLFMKATRLIVIRLKR